MMFKKLCKNVALLLFLLTFLGGQVYVLRVISEVNISTLLQSNEEHDNEDDSRDELDAKKIVNVTLTEEFSYFVDLSSSYNSESPSYYDGDFASIFGPPPDYT